MPQRPSRLSVSFALFFAALSLRALEWPPAGPMAADFWIDLEPLAAPGEPWPLPPETAAKRLLEEASWVMAGAIWGFDFSYTPYDSIRKIAESFSLKPLGSLPWGDSRLKPVSSKRGVSEFSARIEYHPSPEESTLMASRMSAPWVPCQGLGRAPINHGHQGRREAYEDALREAARSYLRSIEPNKPRRVSGRIIFERLPSIFVAEGSYMVRCRARIEPLELLPYIIY